MEGKRKHVLKEEEAEERYLYSDTWAGWLGTRIGVEDHVMCDSMHNLVTFSLLFVNHTCHTSLFAKL